MQDFAELMEAITIKRRSVVDDETKARQEMQETTFTIVVNIQPLNSNKNGDVEMHRTANNGTYALGDILVITSNELQDVSSEYADIVVYEGKNYEIFSKQIYKEPLPHFEYTCCLKI